MSSSSNCISSTHKNVVEGEVASSRPIKCACHFEKKKKESLIWICEGDFIIELVPCTAEN